MAKKARRRPPQEDTLFLQSILENIPNMIFVKEAKELRFVRFNKAGLDLLGRNQNELLGKNDYDFFPKEEADFFTKKDRAVLKSKRPLDIPSEPIHTRKRGTRYLHTKKIPLRDKNGTPRYLLGISEDITERKRAEHRLRKVHEELEERVQLRTAELSRINKALQESEERYRALSAELEQKVDQRTSELKGAIFDLESFSYSVSHDLRAPLRAIEGFSGILLEDHKSSLNSEGQRLLGVVRKSALHLSQLIDDLLSFSRISRKDFIKKRVPMADLAKLVEEDLQQAQNHVDFLLHPIPDTWGDTSLLRQVWTNLLSNAFKFTKTISAPKVEIGAMEKDTETIYFIKDNGVGFDMTFADKLFGVFQRLHSAQDFEGTGVGLAIVQRIITKHGGRVWAEGHVNQGATFYFALPKMEIPQ